MTSKEIYKKFNKGEITLDDIRRMIEVAKRKYKDTFGEEVPNIGGWGFIGDYLEKIEMAVENNEPLKEVPDTIDGFKIFY